MNEDKRDLIAYSRLSWLVHLYDDVMTSVGSRKALVIYPLGTQGELPTATIQGESGGR